MKRILLVVCLIPNITLASIGDELNDLLFSFFGSDETAEKEASPTDTKLPVKNRLYDKFESSDEKLKKIRKEIFFEENILEETESVIQDKLEHLGHILSDKNKAQTDVYLLDTELGSTSKQLNRLLVQEKKWQDQLAQITYEKYNLRALIRSQERAYEKMMQKEFLRNSSFSSTQKVSLMKWLFSDKTVSQILEEKKQIREFQKQKELELDQLHELKREMDKQERYQASLLSRITSLSQQSARMQKSLSEIAYSRANRLARLEDQTGQTEKELENLRRQQSASTLTLQNLSAQMKTMEKNLALNDSAMGASEKEHTLAILDFPLKIPMIVNAHFRDEKYEQELGITHDGVDFWAAQGTDIFAPADGVVKNISSNGYGYSYLILEHENNLHTVYGHVSDTLVNEGQRVKNGDLIAKTGGEQGKTGSGYMTTGPHLHFEVLHSGRFIDPMKVLKMKKS